MAREQITIAGTAYTKTQATHLFRDMLKRYMTGQAVNPADHAAIMDVLPRHPRYADKVGSGVAEIRVVGGGRFGTRQFEIHRTDGTTETISYLVCISPSLDDPDKAALWAMRCEVADQTRQFFDAAHARTAVFCEITGERLTPKNSHVDHMRPLTFQRLVRDFLATKKVTLADVATNRAGPPAWSMANRELAADWQAYHRDHAKLRITSKRANLKERKPHVDFRPTPTLFQTGMETVRKQLDPDEEMLDIRDLPEVARAVGAAAPLREAVRSHPLTMPDHANRPSDTPDTGPAPRTVEG